MNSSTSPLERKRKKKKRKNKETKERNGENVIKQAKVILLQIMVLLPDFAKLPAKWPENSLEKRINAF